MKTAMSIINQLCILFILPFITYVLKETHNLIPPSHHHHIQPGSTGTHPQLPQSQEKFRTSNHLHLSCFQMPFGTDVSAAQQIGTSSSKNDGFMAEHYLYVMPSCQLPICQGLCLVNYPYNQHLNLRWSTESRLPPISALKLL